VRAFNEGFKEVKTLIQNIEKVIQNKEKQQTGSTTKVKQEGEAYLKKIEEI
jgi:ElaB/YqjD/DUF883 family membrane-anchored ribosome-binding protein